MSTAEQLSLDAAALVPQLRALVRDRQAAVAAGDAQRAAVVAEKIKQVAMVYNGYVSALRELEGPGSAAVFLDRVGDIALAAPGVVGGVALDAIEAVGSTTGNVIESIRTGAGLTLANVLPILAVVGVVLIAVVFVGGRSGAVRVRF